METVRRTVRLHPKQIAFRRSRALFRGFVGGRGAGKTWCGAYDLLRRARPGLTYLVASPTGVKLADETYPTFKKIATDLGAWAGVKLTPYPTATLRLEGGDATVRFRTAEDPEKLRGPNLSGVWLDEASLMREDAYKISIACLREGGRMGWLSATFTPKGRTHWTFRTFGTGRPDTGMFRCPTRENPFLPAAFEATIRRQYGPTQFARQELGGEFVAVEGAEWSPEMIDRPGRVFRDWPPPERIVATVIALDPSKGAREDSDYQAFAVARVDKDATIWVDVEANREGVQGMIARGLDLCRRYAPLHALVIEDNDGLGMLVAEFRRQLADRLHLVPIAAVRNTVNKVFRLRRLGGYLDTTLATGPQLRVRDTPGGRLLLGQMSDFPLGEYDDCIDALELALRGIEELLPQ